MNQVNTHIAQLEAENKKLKAKIVKLTEIIDNADTNSTPSFPFVTQSASLFVPPTNKFDFAWTQGCTFYPKDKSKIASGHDWRRTKDRCQTELIKLAKDKKLDHEGLAACLKVVLNDKRNQDLAVVPVAACQLKRGDEIIWIISCIWEVASWVDEEKREDSLGHVREFAVSASTRAILAFSTCD